MLINTDDGKQRTLLLLLVIAKGYGERATTTEGQNAFVRTLCFA